MKPLSFLLFLLLLLPIFFGCSTKESIKNDGNKDEITTTQHNKGSIVISTDKNSFLVVQTYPPNLLAGDRYSAIKYEYPDSSHFVKVGQRVEVEDTGSIEESYPAKGIAKNIKVLSDYKPIGAKLSESEILREAIKIAEKRGKFVPGFRYINFDKENNQWTIGILQDAKTYELKIEDK